MNSKEDTLPTLALLHAPSSNQVAPYGLTLAAKTFAALAPFAEYAVNAASRVVI